MLTKERIYLSLRHQLAEQLSTSVLAEQLSVIEVGVKKLYVVYAANDNFYGGASPQSPRGSYATEGTVKTTLSTLYSEGRPRPQ